MNIGASNGLPALSTTFEVRRSGANGKAEQNQAPNQATAGGNQAKHAEEPSSNTDKLASPEARREALNDPNSALYKELQALKNRDREVRTHEQAHLAAAGPYALGGPTYQFQRGPDGQRYAVGGHVNIDTSEVAGNPEATLRKADTIRRAALAPAEPSPQDRRVAAQASSLALNAKQDLVELQRQKTEQRQAESSNETGETKPDNKARDKLEGEIRNTGALGNAEPNLDLIA